jgi:hypothetical protein
MAEKDRIDKILENQTYMIKMLEELSLTLTDKRMVNDRLHGVLNKQLANIQDIISKHPAIKGDEKSAAIMTELFQTLGKQPPGGNK